MSEAERQRRGNARAAIALLLLTALAGYAAWRNRPDPTSEERPQEVGGASYGDPTITDEMLRGRGAPSRPGLHVTVVNADAGAS